MLYGQISVPAVHRIHAKLYKMTGGRFFGGGDNGSVPVLTHRGAKSGKVRDTPLMFVRDESDYLIIASAGGDVHNPGCYHNLLANPDTTINVSGEAIQVTARDAGPPRDELWAKVVATDPRFGNYESKTERVIPVVILEPR
ncbi:MAG: nitroreductase family deazaflavin-dependent oxidoreductase [Acidimicrobiia bacterium]|nr:nitroreductase family deazaflavin-dependent oxidoreductase [Acidimicrobiia bacterium]MDX2468380.1 nitroreductase family deazaflavin-dependent oxidoreductase [Acidimicrobiia bacterium]